MFKKKTKKVVSSSKHHWRQGCYKTNLLFWPVKVIKSHWYWEIHCGLLRLTNKKLVLVMQHLITMTEQIAVTYAILYVSLGIANALFFIPL